MKKTSTSTETRSSSSESSHSSSSHSHGKITPTTTLQPANPTDSNNPESIFQFSDWEMSEIYSAKAYLNGYKATKMCAAFNTKMCIIKKNNSNIIPILQQ